MSNASPADHPEQPLEQPLSVLGVSARRRELFAKLEVRTVGDLLYFAPRRHLDLRRVTPLDELIPDEMQMVEGFFEDLRERAARGVPIVEGVFRDDRGAIVVDWRHRPELAHQLEINRIYRLIGVAKAKHGWRMHNPRLAPPGSDLDDPQAGPGMVPIYPLTDGLAAEAVRELMRHALTRFAAAVPEMLPEDFRAERGLAAVGEALWGLHFPNDPGHFAACRRRLAWDEFLVLQAALTVRRHQQIRQPACRVRVTAEIDRRIRRLFPFPFTRAQDRAVRALADDLDSDAPMYRMLQGDVGSGKTAIAAYSLLATIAAGYQGALLAPTEVLALQHFRTMDQLLAQSRVRRMLMTGSLTPAERQAARARLAEGAVDLVVGTHSILQKEVRFARLGMVVIDEQHKFGVWQRAGFQQLERAPHHLVMTATPIPRSLAMVWFGDLEVTVLDEKPPGRRPTITKVVPNTARDQAYGFLRQRIDAGAQGLIVCPRIDERDQRADGDAEGLFDAAPTQGDTTTTPIDRPPETARGAVQVMEEMAAALFAGVPLGLAHGRLNDDQKESVVRRFRDGDIKVLVSTVVVEVGLDVPNAEVVIIENADRFGLSQLHQIRGRVGRGGQRGICFLVHSSTDPETIRRLQTLARCDDGFRIAELDAELRGIGEPIGARQHGFVRPRIGDYLRDRDLLVSARQAAAAIVASDPQLASPQWAELRRRVLARYGKSLTLALVG